MRIRSSIFIGTVSAVVVAALIDTSETASPAEARRGPECTITGTNGDDDLKGTGGPDVICAGDGDDRVDGRGGDDVIFGGRGRDDLFAWNGDDRVSGGTGDDLIFGMRGDDRLFGQDGADAVMDWLGQDLLLGGRAGDRLHADDGHPNDRLFGGARRDSYCADAGDRLRSLEEALDRTDCETSH